MENYSRVKFNTLVTSILVLVILNNFYVQFTWLINILILFNIRKIPKKNIFYIVRLTGYFIHLIGFYFLYRILIDEENNIREISITILISICLFFCCYIYLNKQSLKLYFSDSYISSFDKKERKEYIYSIYVAIGAAIGEELYFRYILIESLYSLGMISILISGVYFMLAHYILPWGYLFSRKDLLNQFIFGFFSASVYYYSQEILLSIFCHIMMNIHTVVFNIKSYIYYYINKNDVQKEEDIFDELEV